MWLRQFSLTAELRLAMFSSFQRCIPEFENAAFNLPIEATNTCGTEEDTEFCVQTGFSNKKSCDFCREGDHTSDRLSDLHDPKSPTWWQSETIYEGIQHPTSVNLTLNLGETRRSHISRCFLTQSLSCRQIFRHHLHSHCVLLTTTRIVRDLQAADPGRPVGALSILQRHVSQHLQPARFALHPAR